jgi:hypothetical protein
MNWKEFEGSEDKFKIMSCNLLGVTETNQQQSNSR